MCIRDSATTGFLVYQHYFDFNGAKKAGDGIVRSTSFMHHDYNAASMPRELDESEGRMHPLSPEVARLWAVCRDLPFAKVQNLVQGYAFAGDELMRRELEQCRPSVRVRLEQTLIACEKASSVDIRSTYKDLVDLQNTIVTGHAVVRGRLAPLSLVRSLVCWESFVSKRKIHFCMAETTHGWAVSATTTVCTCARTAKSSRRLGC